MARQRKYAYETENKPFPKRLRQLMEDTGTTQEELAAAVGVQRQTISKYASGLNTPDIEKFERIADFFNVSFDYLLGRSKSKRHENHDIVEETGLSEAAVERLKAFKALGEVLPAMITPPRNVACQLAPVIPEIVSEMIESEHFLELMEDLNTLRNLKDAPLKRKIIEYYAFMIGSTMRRMFYPLPSDEEDE